MTISDPTNPPPRSLVQGLLSAARYYLGSRTGMIAVAALAPGLGAYFNWGWLVAAGIAPLLIGVLPCVAMCGLGLCMGRKTPRSRSSESEEAAIGDSSEIRIAASPQGSNKTPTVADRKTKDKKECC